MTQFETTTGTLVPAITAAQMREVDRVAMEDFGLGILQMMENAGRALAQNTLEMLGGAKGPVAVLAGSGGNGGGGLCAARHLHNHGADVAIILSKPPLELRGAVLDQLNILLMAGVQPTLPEEAKGVIRKAALVIDALIGYSLRGAPRGRVAELIAITNRYASNILTLDVPSGLDATTGETPGVAIHPDRTLTLALPKTGLVTVPGDLYLADIGIPPGVFRRVGIGYFPLFGDQYTIRLIKSHDQGEQNDQA